MKHKTPLQIFWKRGPYSSVDLLAWADPLGLQKYWLHHFYAQAWIRMLALKVTLHSSPLERESPHSSGHQCLQNILGARILRSSGGSPARADFKDSGFYRTVLELKFDIQSFQSSWFWFKTFNYITLHENERVWHQIVKNHHQILKLSNISFV